eukprot:c1941_g1_i1.p1 GENE.c1941_g1_i1~~c1941_g1_i1.p1  ORF type:complete len:754 (+),score=150.53 c1941_g1_i1:55-2262(+)
MSASDHRGRSCFRLGACKLIARNLRRSAAGRLEQSLRLHPAYNMTIVCATIFSVFGDDFRVAWLPKSSDPGIQITFYCCFCLFVLDMLLSILFERKYLRSIIFVLDLVATGSILLQPLLDSNNSTQTLVLARLSRMVRILRIMRIARFAMVSQEQALQGAEKRRVTARTSVVHSSPITPSTPRSRPRSHSIALSRAIVGVTPTSPCPTSDPSAIPNRSMLGVRLMQKTTEKIILLVLVLAIGIQLLDPNYQDETAKNGLKLLHSAYPWYDRVHCFDNTSALFIDSRYCVQTNCCPNFSQLVDQYTRNFASHGKLIELRLHGVLFFLRSDPNTRTDYLRLVEVADSSIKVDLGMYNSNLAKWSMLQTLIIFITLMIFPYSFGRDVLALVISPLEMIFDRVQLIASNPFHLFAPSTDVTSSHELGLIKESLSRLTKLLQVGLGQASSEIISQNLKSGNFSAVQEGRLLDAIFCFCDIRNFSDYCDVLQEDCVIFVNKIAEVVGDEVVKESGYVNKNIGEAFLLVWKWNTNRESFQPQRDEHQTAEASLRASLSIIKSVATNGVIQSFAKRQDIRERLGGTFRVSVGVGLHVGWAIEGAVGSEQKIDATYLSPTVNTTARLESGTRQYGVPLLMSRQFVSLLLESKEFCRRVDCVAVKGSQEPIELLTYEDRPELIEMSDSYYDLYIAGDWPGSKAKLDEFFLRWPSDGPALAIWEYMEENRFLAPEDWSGYRKLTAK